MNIDVPEDIIIPPPSIRSVIHKTVVVVARNGPQFEEKIRQQPQSSKFTFLEEQDAYNAYYRFMLEHGEELMEQDDAGKNGETGKRRTKKEVVSVPELEFLVTMPTITPKDLEIVKLTAQFVAVNGHDYRQAIRNKYRDQLLQFGFMESGHSLNPLFESYVEQYQLVLRGDIEVPKSVEEMLERAYKRAEWEETREQETHEKQKLEDDKKLRFARVDWNDFVIVETIEFSEVDAVTELDPPVTIDELQLRSLDEKSKQVTVLSLPLPTLTTSDSTVSGSAPPGIKIREFGTTRLKSVQQKERLFQCPITGKMVPESGFQQHMEILLRNPQYQEEKAKYEAKIKNTNLSPEEVFTNIKALLKPKSSTDVNKRQKVAWDGYQSSVDFVKHKNRASESELDEFKRKEREPVIGPTKP